MSARVAVGLVLPIGELLFDGVEPTWADISAQVKRAEEVGFDTVWTVDESSGGTPIGRARAAGGNASPYWRGGGRKFNRSGGHLGNLRAAAQPRHGGAGRRNT